MKTISVELLAFIEIFNKTSKFLCKEFSLNLFSKQTIHMKCSIWGGSTTAATSKMEHFVIYYHKELHLGCCSSPRSASWSYIWSTILLSWQLANCSRIVFILLSTDISLQLKLMLCRYENKLELPQKLLMQGLSVLEKENNIQYLKIALIHSKYKIFKMQISANIVLLTLMPLLY